MMTAAARSAAAVKANATRKLKKSLPPPPPRKRMKLAPQEPIKLPKNVAVVPVAEMMAKTVVLVLTISGIGNRRKIDPKLIQVDADKDWINATKKLYNSEELDEINSIGNETRMWVESRALPSNIKRGVHLLPVDFIEETDAHLKEANARRRPLVEKMIRRLDVLEAEAKERLKTLHDPSQNFTPDQLRAAFSITWRYVYVDSAKNLESVSPELYAEECKKAEAAGAELRETIQQLLRTQFAEKVHHFVDRLTPGEDGRQKVFRDGSVDKMEEFLATFTPRNITNDVQMRILVDKAKSLMGHADADTLRTNEDLREYVRHGFETIQSLLDPMIASKPHRRIQLED
jgi:hypothetical protein